MKFLLLFLIVGLLCLVTPIRATTLALFVAANDLSMITKVPQKTNSDAIIAKLKIPTYNYPTVVTALNYIKANLAIMNTEGDKFTATSGFTGVPSTAKIDYIMTCWGNCVTALRASVNYTLKVAPHSISVYQNRLTVIDADMIKVRAELVRALGALPSTAFRVSMTDPYFTLMIEDSKNLTDSLNNLATTYMAALNSSVVLLCVEHENNGTRSAISQYFPSKNVQMYASTVASRAAIASVYSSLPSKHDIPDNVKEYCNQAYANLHETARTIEQQCMDYVCDKTAITPGRRSYSSWGLKNTYPYKCTFDLSKVVSTFDTLHADIFTALDTAVANANTFLTDTLPKSLDSINATAENIQLQLKTMVNGLDCIAAAPCVNTTYNNLIPIVKAANQGFANCVTNVLSNLQSNANTIMDQYHKSDNFFHISTETCLVAMGRTFDQCLTVSVDPTFPEYTSTIRNSMKYLFGTEYEVCRATVKNTFNTAITALKNTFYTCSGVRMT